MAARKTTDDRAGRSDSAAERREAETDNVADSIENLDRSPPHPLMVVPRPMACGAMVMSVIGMLVGAAIGFGIGAAVYGVRASVGVIVFTVVLAFAGLVAGAVFGGWEGGLGAKTRDEHRRSHAGRAPGTRPVRRGGQPEDEPIGWE